MSKTTNVRSENQSGGVTAGEIRGDVSVDQNVTTESPSRDLPVWAKYFAWAVGIAAGVVGIVTFFGG
ncbi:MAG: hypothetical protein QNI98_09015 [Woeseiaceae bacterium]|nr:hypothetical protein [Woeseiaceae bacterium]